MGNKGTTPWKMYAPNYWGRYYDGHHQEFWPSKGKYRYRGCTFVASGGREAHMGWTEDLIKKDKAEEARVAENLKKIKSTGWATSYYDIPDHVKDVDDLITHFKLNWHMANIVKAAIRYGRKEGVSKEYDLNKIEFMAKRERNLINATD